MFLNENSESIMQDVLQDKYEMVISGEYKLVEFLQELSTLNGHFDKNKFYEGLRNEGLLSRKEAKKLMQNSLEFKTYYEKGLRIA
jgi:hypothetical protein